MSPKSSKKTVAKNFAETDLYPPIQKFFTELDYQVNAEVKGCDVAMTKNGELIIIELKKSFNLTVLYQAMDRQKLTTQVYIAVPRPKTSRDTAYRNMLQIVKKLELGLMTVAMDSPLRHVEILAFPPVAQVKSALKKPARRESVLKEMAGRTLDTNLGGSTRRKLVTAYREKVLHIACALESHGAMNKNELIALGCDAKAYNILRANQYGWFEKVSKGRYGLSAEGICALEDGNEFETLIAFYRDKAQIEKE